MVMPCSRSALKPSVNCARSASPLLETLASWSSSTLLLSSNRRPIRVLLPSSTLPQVMNLRAELVSNWALDSAVFERSAIKLVVFMLVFLVCRNCLIIWGAGRVLRLRRYWLAPRNSRLGRPPHTGVPEIGGHPNRLPRRRQRGRCCFVNTGVRGSRGSWCLGLNFHRF